MNAVRHFTANGEGRDFVVGDMHGHRALFDQLLAGAKFDQDTDRVFSVGDLIDRGPSSRECLMLLDEPWFFAVRGNHEDMMRWAIAGSDHALMLWIQNGGAWVSGCEDEFLRAAKTKLDALPLVITVGEGAGRFNVLHAETYMTDAELDAGQFDGACEQQLMWGRSILQGRGIERDCFEVSAAGIRQPGLSTTYVGHTVVRAIKRVGSHVFIDTGSFISGGTLTMIEPATGICYRARNGDIDADGWLPA